MAVGGADPAATVADDPAEEVFAGVADWEAAMVGVCAFEVELLMDSVGGVKLRAAVCAVAGVGRMAWALCVAEGEGERRPGVCEMSEAGQGAEKRVVHGAEGARSTPFGKGRRGLSERFTGDVNRVGTGGFRQETCEMCKRLPRWSPLQVEVVMSGG